MKSAKRGVASANGEAKKSGAGMTSKLGEKHINGERALLPAVAQRNKRYRAALSAGTPRARVMLMTIIRAHARTRNNISYISWHNIALAGVSTLLHQIDILLRWWSVVLVHISMRMRAPQQHIVMTIKRAAATKMALSASAYQHRQRQAAAAMARSEIMA